MLILAFMYQKTECLLNNSDIAAMEFTV